MGRGTIVSGGEDGLYQVKLDFGKGRMVARQVQVQTYIDALEPIITETESFVAESRGNWEAAKTELDTLVEAYAALLADPRDTDEIKRQREQARKDLAAKTREVSSTLATYQANKSILERRKLERENYRARLASLQAVETERTVSAWCADLTEDATDDVVTIEVPGEPRDVLVAPGGAKPNPTIGILLKREAMSPEQAFYNAAVLPGWQKWRPLYAFAKIDAIDTANDTATITFTAAKSSADGLDVTPGRTMHDVPVRYMTCNAGAFEDGDDVVVQFPTQRLESARVIGFKREPRPCGWIAYYGTWNGATMFIDAPAVGAERYFAAPAGEYFAQWRAGGGGWETIALTSVSSTARRWDATGMPDDGSVLVPGIEVIAGGASTNAYLILRVQVFRSGADGVFTYTPTGVNEFRMLRDGKRLFHFAYQVSNGHASAQDPYVVARPFLVGGAAIREPKSDQQPFLPHVDDVIPGWVITP